MHAGINGQRLADSQALRDFVETSLQDDKAEDIVVIDLAKKSTLADYMIIASGRSARHVVSLAENLEKRIKQSGQCTPKTEGKRQGDWVLMDAGDVIVHLFRPEVRDFYALEKMWTMPQQEASSVHPLG